MKIKKKYIFRFFGPFFSSFIIFGWDFVENEKNHQKSTVILLHFWLSKQKNYFWSHAKLAKMSSFQCTVPPLPPPSSWAEQWNKLVTWGRSWRSGGNWPLSGSFSLGTDLFPRSAVIASTHIGREQMHFQEGKSLKTKSITYCLIISNAVHMSKVEEGLFQIWHLKYQIPNKLPACWPDLSRDPPTIKYQFLGHRSPSPSLRLAVKTPFNRKLLSMSLFPKKQDHPNKFHFLLLDLGLFSRE